MEPAKIFNNVIIGQFVLTGVPVKVYVDGRYLIITESQDVEDPIYGFGMDEDSEMQQFDYFAVEHLLVNGNVIEIDSYNKGMGATEEPESDKADAEEDKESDKLPKESIMPSIKDILAEISQEEVDAEVEGAEAEMDSAKAKLKAAQAAMKNTIKKSKEKIKAAKSQPIDEALDGSFANAQKVLRNSTVIGYEFDRRDNGEWFILIKYVPMNKQKVELTVVNIGQDYSTADLRKIKREFGLDKPVKKKYKLSNPMSGGQGYGEIFEDHHYTFGVGDIVKNKNGSCPHHGSMGIVKKVMELPNEMGTVAIYTVINSGPTYKPGDSLTKTIDQLEPITAIGSSEEE